LRYRRGTGKLAAARWSAARHSGEVLDMLAVVRVIAIVVASAAAMSAVLIGPAGIATAAPSCFNWTGAQPPSGQTSTANGVAVVSRCNAWLVGQGNSHVLSLRWNGSSWHYIAVPEPNGTIAASLNGAAETAASDVWAVGYAFAPPNTGTTQALAVHWNGSAWSIVPAKKPGTSSNLLGVAARTPSDVWAVGRTSNGTTSVPMVEHRNGVAWKVFPLPALPSGGTNGGLQAVSATSRTNAWAVGSYYVGTNVMSLILHWDGAHWSRQQSRNPSTVTNFLFGVSATSSTNAWAVGRIFDGSGFKTLIERWNGSKWKVQASPNTKDFDNTLFGVTATSSADAWAVGRRVARIGGVDQQPQTLILHWDGAAWTIVPSPNPGGPGQENQLLAVDASSASNVWAGGVFYNGSNNQALAVHCC
jgi:hypothetical protein